MLRDDSEDESRYIFIIIKALEERSKLKSDDNEIIATKGKTYPENEIKK